MPRRTRLQFAPSPELLDALKAFSEITGYTKSSIISSFLEQNIHVIKAMTEAFSVAKTNPEQAIGIMEKVVQEATEEAKEVQHELSGLDND